jgi:hypothetical protein
VTLAAVRRFEAAAGRAGTGREADWLDQVAADLAILEEAVKAESNEFLRVDSLLSMIARDYLKGSETLEHAMPPARDTR